MEVADSQARTRLLWVATVAGNLFRALGTDSHKRQGEDLDFLTCSIPLNSFSYHPTSSTQKRSRRLLPCGPKDRMGLLYLDFFALAGITIMYHGSEGIPKLRLTTTVCLQDLHTRRQFGSLNLQSALLARCSRACVLDRQQIDLCSCFSWNVLCSFCLFVSKLRTDS